MAEPEVSPVFETGDQLDGTSRLGRAVHIGALVGFLVISLGCTWITLWILTSPDGTPGIVLVCAAITFFIAYMGWCFMAAALARFRFLPEGLAATYPLHQEILIPWEEFQQVCVCYVGYPHQDAYTGSEIRPGVICCVKKGEKKDIFGRWKENPFRYRSVIYLIHKPEYLAALRQVCPYPVPDLRGLGNYRY